MFLSTRDKFDKDLNSEETECKPIWVKKSNYMSLLNLPKQMSLFGPLRRYREGSYRGEALVQDFKPLIKTVKLFPYYATMNLLIVLVVTTWCN